MGSRTQKDLDGSKSREIDALIQGVVQQTQASKDGIQTTTMKLGKFEASYVADVIEPLEI
jgi:hypothetical protein